VTQFKARPTTYKGIKMRSRLEAGFAAWLDEFSVEWNYEPRAYAAEEGQYLPDFELPEISFAGNPRRVFVEIKPRQPDLATLLAQRRIIKASEPQAKLVAVWPDGDHYRSMLVLDEMGQTVIWTVRSETIALEIELPACNGPWFGEYWKPKTVTQPAAPELPAPAHDLDVERRVIVAFLLSASTPALLFGPNRPGRMFYRPAHRMMFQAIDDLAEQGEPTDAVTLAAELNRRGELERCGGAAYLRAILELPAFDWSQLGSDVKRLVDLARDRGDIDVPVVSS